LSFSYLPSIRDYITAFALIQINKLLIFIMPSEFHYSSVIWFFLKRIFLLLFGGSKSKKREEVFLSYLLLFITKKKQKVLSHCLCYFLDFTIKNLTACNSKISLDAAAFYQS